MQYIFNTDRLRVRQLRHADSDFIVELVNTEGWLKYIGDRNIKSEDDALNYLNNGPLKSYSENGFGLWMVETKAGDKIGICGILTRAYLQHPDIGFAFLPQHYGVGFAIETVQATLLYAMRNWQLPKIYAIMVPKNDRSINLVEKLGFTFVENIVHENNALLLYSYQ